MNDINITTFDMNKMELETQKIINLDETLIDEIEYLLDKKDNHYLLARGLDLQGVILGITDTKKLLRYILNYLYEDYSIIDCQGYKGGHPDFILRKDSEEIYLEVKINEDTLRQTQLRWFSEHKNTINKVMFIRLSIQDYRPKLEEGEL